MGTVVRVKIKPRVKFTARWPGPIQGHAVNTVKKFFPSLQNWHEFEDLLQEAFLVFYRCKKLYTEDQRNPKWGRVNNPKWFMVIFSRALENKLKNMIKHGPRYNFTGDLALRQRTVGEPTTDGLGYLWRLVNEIPAEIMDLLENAVDNNSAKVRGFAQERFENWLNATERPRELSQ